MISNYAGMQKYVAMLEDLHGVISDMVDAGKSLEEVIAANPTAKYDEAQGDSSNFVNRAYTSIKRSK